MYLDFPHGPLCGSCRGDGFGRAFQQVFAVMLAHNHLHTEFTGLESTWFSLPMLRRRDIHRTTMLACKPRAQCHETTHSWLAERPPYRWISSNTCCLVASNDRPCV